MNNISDLVDVDGGYVVPSASLNYLYITRINYTYMDFNRKFEHVVDGKQVIFDVTYNPQTHFFHVLETDDTEGYLLKFDMTTRTWSIDGTSQSEIGADELAVLVQKNFGHFV